MDRRWITVAFAGSFAALMHSPVDLVAGDEPPPTASASTTEESPSASAVDVVPDAVPAELPVPAAPVAKKPAAKAPPKKKAPPVFPGPKVLPPTGPYKPLYFDNDFSTKDKPGEPYIFGEEAKLMKFEMFDTDFVFSTGGELRHRFMSQDNRLQPGGPGQDTYNLWRWRHYVDLKAGNNFRFYVEGINADSFGEDLPIQQIDVNRWDLLNAFVDVKLFDTDTGSHTLRYGRQELLFGRQRLASPLDWANTRRNFEGFRYMVKEKDWKFDAFAVNPVNSATGYRNVFEFDNKFDKANRDVWFSGTYFTYTGLENANLDLYWLWLNDTEPVATRADGRRHTLGSRYSWLVPIEQERTWDFDVEGAYQFGDDNGKALWTPRLSGLAYYGSGDVDRADDQTNTFDVLFPLGHAYWAISDNLAGQNLVDLSAQIDVKPTSKTALVAAYHKFRLANDDDRLYNVAGAPVGAPGNGTDVGEEQKARKETKGRSRNRLLPSLPWLLFSFFFRPRESTNIVSDATKPRITFL
jgi:hypothetical protein